MSIEKVRAYLTALGYEDRIVEFAENSATVELAAKAAGVEPARIAKSLAFRVGERVILVVCAGDTRIDNRKFKTSFGAKPSMLSFEKVEELIGYAVGGVCPFAVNEGVEIFLDEGLLRFDVVLPAAGSDNSCVRVSPAELERLSKANGWVDVCR